MRCVTPMFRLYHQYSPEEEAWIKENEAHKWQKIIPREQAYKMLIQDEYKFRKIEELNNQWEKSGSIKRMQQIPCGHCWACFLNKAADWATRCMFEAQKYPDNYWITLTYDDEHLPIAEWIKYKKYEGKDYHYEILYNEGQEKWQEGTVQLEELQRFINTMRKDFERRGHTGIRYFAAAEYGSKNHRPHYHVIFFNLPLKIDEFYDCHIEPRDKSMRWKSREIDKWWKQGIAEVTEVEWSNCSYTARYNSKALIDGAKKQEEYAQQGKIKEFVTMSRKPGIGADYFNENMQKIYENDEIIIQTYNGSCVVKPPKAWDRKFQELFPEQYEQLKKCRIESMERAEKLKRELANYTDLERLKMDTENIIRKGELLIREL